ncbi:hypothetical protein SPBR_05720 [Sporothrix brasiliensis 5110]|uniref:C2H2-type domain-containing protein n=1 Tax=Sporothrix brasiliensis 5110 TaxID=1398154 RepID=A0A0C2IYS2_9PEZI|nr:uncharacterized protein SPBR_05720 [Sporothrix brasiliensis 5110]KIH94256.1 hypothetical protein SPBR_05720 [Sporothrix brasiliensis 5110]
MEIPRPAPRPQGGHGLPSIYIDDDMPSSSYHEDDRPPPPLPPPRVVPVYGPMSAAAEEYRRRELEPVEELPNYKTRQDRDEGYHSMESRSRDSFTSAKFGMHHDHYQFKSSADAYDNSLLKKLDMRRTLDNRSPPRLGRLSASARDALRPADRFPALQPLSLPTRMKQPHGQPLLDSPNRYTDTPMVSAVSPRSTPFSHRYNSSGYRSPRSDMPDYDRSPVGARNRRTNSGSITDDASVHDPMDDDTSFTMEETRLRDFHIDTPLSRAAGDYHAAGQKRRASSPPGGDEPPMPLYNMTSSEHLRWREGASRGSPAPRLSANTQDSISSVSSSTRTGSYSSNLSGAATSVTSMAVSLANGQGRRSPNGGVSPPGGMSPTETANASNSASTCTSPFASTVPLQVSPRSAASASRPQQERIRETAHIVSSPTRRLPDMTKSTSLLKRSEFFMCDCCPKKPKKFDSEDQLRAHEMEKQYECNYCGNRFKNKNEAERHQNSLHVRRHSWSCAALSSYDRAFHESTFRPGEADTCGYCGEEFMRSGFATGRTDARHTTEQDWDDRIRHLQDVHKFRECNASKKFFRADHFRQHLKHSHAGTSGKWTNMLENACMMEEEPPLPIR